MDVDIPNEKYKKKENFYYYKDCRGTIIWITRRWKSRQINNWKFKGNESDSDELDYNSQYYDEGENYKLVYDNDQKHKSNKAIKFL